MARNLTLAEMHALANEPTGKISDLIEAAMSVVAVEILDTDLVDMPEDDRRRTLAMSVLDYGTTLNQGRLLVIISFFPKKFKDVASVQADESALLQAVRDAWATLAGGTVATSRPVVELPLAQDPTFLSRIESALIETAKTFMDSPDSTKAQHQLAGQVLAAPSDNARRMAPVIIAAKRDALTRTSTDLAIAESTDEAFRREAKSRRIADTGTVDQATNGPDLNRARSLGSSLVRG
jgi:hypothetical protein